MSNNDDNLYAMRHSLAHIMATAIQDLWPEVKLGVGPSGRERVLLRCRPGRCSKLSEEDFPRIEAKMQEIIKRCAAV
jgi:threonyl-tRNA synthetase